MTDATQGPGAADKNTAAPERIWAWPTAGHVYGTWSVTTTFGGAEYRRADALAAALARVQALEGALTKIAAFDDAGACDFLDKNGSYAAFDEPGGVETARAALKGGAA
jgi:hypothetical protein